MQDKPDNAAPEAQPRLLGSLKEALAAARRTDPELRRPPGPAPAPNREAQRPDQKAGIMTESRDVQSLRPAPPGLPAAAGFAGSLGGGTPNVPPVSPPGAPPGAAPADEPGTQLVRGRQTLERGGFKSDPVVGWLVIVGGNGIGAFRPIFEGNNTIGRAPANRIPIDFGDNTISGHEQAYIRYDSTDRSFLFVPNLAKTNIVSVNDERPTAAVSLEAMDVITMGRTQLVFVPFCGPEFDWSELAALGD